MIAVAMGFLAMAIPAAGQGRLDQCRLGGAGRALLIFGMRIRSLGLRGLGTILLLSASADCSSMDLPHYSARYFVMFPFMHAYGLSSLGGWRASGRS